MIALRSKAGTRPRLLFFAVAVLLSTGAAIGYSQQADSGIEQLSALKLESKLLAVLERVRPSVVLLGWREKNRTPTTGVIFDKEGLILTHCHHDQQPGTELDVLLPDGRRQQATLETVFDTWGGPEWSLIRIHASGPWPAVSLKLSGNPSVEEPCFLLGYPGVTTRDDQLLSPVLRLGQVVGVSDCGVYAACPAVPGDSGSPLFNLDGEIIGILRASIRGPITSSSRVPQLCVSHRALRLLTVTRRELDDLGILGDNQRPIDPNRGIPLPGSQNLSHFRRSLVQVTVDGKAVAMGIVVREGVVATKRSEILLHNGKRFGDISCRLESGLELPAEIIADSHTHDVALLRVDDRSMPTLQLATDIDYRQGELISALISPDENPISGTVSTIGAFRVNAHPGGVGAFDVNPTELGIRIDVGEEFATPDDSSNPLEWYSYSDGRLKHGDVISHVNGVGTQDKKTWRAATEDLIAGDLVQVTVRHNQSTETLVFPSGASYWRAFDSAGPLSHRRTGFPEVFGHDALITAQQCGSPVIDRRGNVIGMNIARFHKHQTLAIPSKTLATLVDELLAGQ